MSIPVCPMMSAGNNMEVVCAQEKCAWYIKNLKICSVYAIGHDAMLNIRSKQVHSKPKQ